MKKADANFLPVVQRELREGARRPFNYWLRVGAATAGLLLLYNILRSAGAVPSAAGLYLFTSLHQMMLALICVIVPTMSADCIAREKREGTLGLLFLTPLTALGIVVGKGVMQFFRAFTLWLAMLPILIIPYLLGGITATDIYSAIIMEFCVTLLALAAGIMASSLAKTRNAAFVFAATFMFAFICLFGRLLGLSLYWQTSVPRQQVQLTQLMQSGRSLITGQFVATFFIISSPYAPPVTASFTPLSGGGSVSSMTVSAPGGIRYVATLNGVQYATFWGPVPPTMTPTAAGWGSCFSTPAARHALRSALIESLLAVPILFFLILRVAAHFTKNSWQEKGPSPRRESWLRTYCVPLARDRFKRKLQRLLDWNPIAWLQLYSWKSGVIRWGLCLLFVLLECKFSANTPFIMLRAQTIMLVILAAVFCFVGVSGFLTEKKSGALELLLVTPISPEKIIFGRVWGLWLQFLPAAVTLFLCRWIAEKLVVISASYTWPVPYQFGEELWNFMIHPVTWGYNIPRLFHDGTLQYLMSPAFHTFVGAVGFLTLPVFATYFALRIKNLLTAAALTSLSLLLCPYFAFTILGALSIIGDVSLTPSIMYEIVFLTNLAFALLACFLLRHSLSRRIYAF